MLAGERLEARLVDQLEELDAYRSDWDALAVSSGRPYCCPAWMLAWWRHVRPPQSELRVVVVLDGGRLVGIAPFFVTTKWGGLSAYRLLGSGAGGRLQPLARPGFEEALAEAVSRGLEGGHPPASTVSLDSMDARSAWPGMLADAWPGRRKPRIRRGRIVAAPTVALTAGSFEEWLASKSAHFRKRVRGARRKLEALGAVYRMASDVETIDRDLASFARLHYGRWARDGGSDSLDASVERMLRDAALELIPSGRLRLWLIEVDGEAIAADVILAAGGECATWNGGYDRAWEEFSPGLQTTLAAIEDGFRRGERRLDLGSGAVPYKLRLSDGDDPKGWWTLFPRDARYPLTRVRLAPRHLRGHARSVVRRLPPSAKRQLKRLRRA